MCFQVIEVFGHCGCLYYKHPVDSCSLVNQRGHSVARREIKVGYECPRHSVQSSYSGSTPSKTLSTYSQGSSISDSGDSVFSKTLRLSSATSDSEIDVHGTELKSNRHRYSHSDPLKAISAAVLEPISTSGGGLEMHIKWELPMFCEQELEQDSDLAYALSITGTARAAWAAISYNYLRYVWPMTYACILSAINGFRRGNFSTSYTVVERNIGVRLSTPSNPGDSGVVVQCRGTLKTLIDIAQSFAWLSAAFRPSRGDKIAYSDIVVEVSESGTLELSLKPLEAVQDNEACCWHPLLQNSVIARGFPILPRTDQVGLEIDFRIMANLAAVLYPLECYNGLVMKGMSSVLIPKARVNDSIQWHLVLGPLNDKLSMDQVGSHDLDQFYETRDLQELVELRAFLGLFESAQVCLGTKESDYQKLGRSYASCEKSRYQLSDKMTASVGSSVYSMWNFTIGFKFSKQKGLRVVEDRSNSLLEMRLKHSQTQPILMFDVGDSRGWLVPELSALLYITHASISRDSDLEALLDSMPYAAEGDPDAAFAAIRDGKDFELRKADQSLTGQPQLFMDFVKHILIGMERRKEKVLTRDNDSGFSLTSSLRRPTLYGWEIEDLITGSMFYKRKEVKLEKSKAGDWCRICENSPDLLVLFCTGLGEPIRPSPLQSRCRLWDPIPTGQGYLVATVRCLQQLAQVYGGEKQKLHSLQLAPDLYWHRPPEGKIFERCSGEGNGCNRLQEVKDKRANPPGPLNPNGAVIFGKATSAKRTSCIIRQDTPGRPYPTPKGKGKDSARARAKTYSGPQEGSLSDYRVPSKSAEDLLK